MEWLVVLAGALATGLFAHAVLSYAPQRGTDARSSYAELQHWFGQRLGPVILERQPDFVARVNRKLELVASPDLPTNGAEFLGANLGIALLAFAVLLLLSLLLGIAIPMALFLSVGMGAILFMLGTRRLDNLLTQRTMALDREFPYFLDFTVMTKRAGAVLIDSIRLFVESAGDTVLAREMGELVNTKASGPGGLLGALEEYLRTCPSEPGRNALMAIIAAEPVGASSATSLVSLASDMRHDRRQRAERAAESIKSSMMMPVTMMLVGVIIMILAGSVPDLMIGF